MKKVYMITAIVLAIVLGFMVNDKIRDDELMYLQPSVFETAFMNGCMESGMESYCQCAWEEMSSRYSETEIASFADDIESGDIPQEIWSVVGECIDEIR